MRSPQHLRKLVRLSLLGLVLVGAAALAPIALAAPPKPYSVTVEPDCVASNQTQSFTITLTNLARNQTLGSANITAPDSFTEVAVTAPVPLPDGSAVVGNTIELRNLNLASNASFVLTVSAKTGPAGSYAWDAIAKQANNFSGPPGNAFVLDEGKSDLTTIVGACTLRFDVQPASAEVGAKITGDAFNPTSANKVKVTALGPGDVPITDFTGDITLAINPGDNPGSTTLAGATTKAASAGSATFDSIWINVYGLGYKLVATSPGFEPKVSSSFDIVDEGVACEPFQDPCTLNVTSQDNLTSNGTTGNVTHTFQTTGGAEGGVIQVGVNQDTIDCTDYDEHLASTVTFDVTTGEAKRITVRIDKKLVTADPNNGVAFYHVCYSSDSTFTDRFGQTVEPGGAGLLPDCTSAPVPCVVSRNKTRAGDVILVFDAPEGDPRYRT